jgi:hypothetical protein
MTRELSIGPRRPRRSPPRAGTADDLARETKLPVGVVEVALTELVNAGRAVAVEPGRFRAR